jgi:murein DD-endopeptidase MepM/ murein hydrolase activator NlpD
MPITPIQVGTYTITSGYGPRTPEIIDGRKGADFHTGIDMAAPKGTAVRSIMDGTVNKVIENDPVYGNNLTITHGADFQSLYAHLDTVTVKQGDPVAGGEIIGTVGSTGFSTGPHLHFEYQDGNGDSIDPHY